MNKSFSWHISSGFGYGESSKKYIITDGKNYYQEYSLHITPFPIIETGFYIKPMKQKNHYIGINFSTAFTSMKTNNYRQSSIIGGVGYINLSYNIQLNKQSSIQ